MMPLPTFETTLVWLVIFTIGFALSALIFRHKATDSIKSDDTNPKDSPSLAPVPLPTIIWSPDGTALNWNKEAEIYQEVPDAPPARALRLPLPYLCLHPNEGNTHIQTLQITTDLYLIAAEKRLSNGQVYCTYTDISSQRKRELQLHEEIRLHQTLSQCSRTLIHARNQSFIFSQVCHNLTTLPHIDNAWISLFPFPNQIPAELEITAHRGIAKPPHLKTTPLHQAFLKSGQPKTFNRDELREFYPQLRESMSNRLTIFPIRIDEVTHGLMHISAIEDESVNPELLSFLKKVTDDISYGLSGLISEQDRLSMENALRESQQHYQSLIDFFPDAILVLDENDKIAFFNPQALLALSAPENTILLGYAFIDLIESDFDLNAPDEEDTYRRVYNSVRVKRFNHQSFEADITISTQTLESDLSKVVVLRDVSERNQVTEQLNQAAKLATLGEMAAGMTHELSQPLNIMRFAAEGTLLKIKRGQVEPKLIETQFQLISKQSERMADIIDHMRVFSRKDTGTIEIFDPAIVIRQSIDLVEQQYFAESIEIMAKYPNHYEKLKGRPIQLEQVILNLITNAHDSILDRRRHQNKASENPSHFDLIDINMTYDQGDHRINIAITDTGTGISQEAQKKLFDPFFTTKEIGKGTGLGLSISYGIITEMGGTIKVRNVHNGARFDLSFPCTKTTATFPPVPSYTPPASTTVAPPIEPPSLPDEPDDEIDLEFDPNAAHILVVDDEVYAAEAMTEYLFAHNYRVSMAGDGEEALDLFKEDPADIIITDIRMPRMNGVELIKHVRKINTSIPIFVVTGHMGVGEELQTTLEGQVTKVFKKPVKLSELVKLVESQLNKE